MKKSLLTSIITSIVLVLTVLVLAGCGGGKQ